VALGRYESGMYLRDACKIVKEYGDPKEKTIKGNTEQPKCAKELAPQLTDEVYSEAKIYRVLSYANCSGEQNLKHALLHYGPVLGSIKWYFKYSLKDKQIIFDKTADHGYHAIVVYGWNEKGWLCQNSWGEKWNGDGKFIYPYGEEFAELWSFVDATNGDIITPKNNQWLNIFYKAFNFIINSFSQKRNIIISTN
jgi:C1A family cysteine protease